MSRWSTSQLKKVNKTNRKSDNTRPIMLNKRSLMIGFDADVTKCGLTLYDVENNKVLEYLSLHFNDISEWLDLISLKYDSTRFYARVEVGDTQSAYGASKNFSKTKKGQKNAFSVVFKSGKSVEIANLFINLLERREIRYETIHSSQRFNIENRKLPRSMVTSDNLKNYVDLPESVFFSRAKLMKITFFSKLKANHIKSFFDLKSTGNSETRDALSLLIPERIFFHNK